MSIREIKRHVLLACGWLSLGLGILGMFLPILPTAPFILLAAACFARSSSVLHRWLVEHPTFGIHIKDFLDGKGLRRGTKAVALLALWVSVAASTLLWVPFVIVDVFIVATAGAVTVYILRLPTSDSDAGTPDR